MKLKLIKAWGFIIRNTLLIGDKTQFWVIFTLFAISFFFIPLRAWLTTVRRFLISIFGRPKCFSAFSTEPFNTLFKVCERHVWKTGEKCFAVPRHMASQTIGIILNADKDVFPSSKFWKWAQFLFFKYFYLDRRFCKFIKLDIIFVWLHNLCEILKFAWKFLLFSARNILSTLE